MKTPQLIILLLILIIAAVLIYFFIFRQQGEFRMNLQIPANTMENLPTVNPYENAKMNPLKDTYKNPFE